MNVLLSILLVIPLVTIVFLLLIVALVWGLGRLSFREFSASTLDMDQPRLPEWLLRALYAAWPIEMLFACVLAPSIAVLVLHDDNPVRLIGNAVLVGTLTYAFGYLIAVVFLKVRIGGGDWWLPVDSGSGEGCELFLIGLVASVVAGLFFLVYYGLVVAICHYLILPSAFRVAGIDNARLPLVFTGKSESSPVSIRASTIKSASPRGSAQTYFDRGVDHYDAADFDQAIADLSQSILLGSTAQTYLYRGLAYYRKGEYDHAIADLNTATFTSQDAEIYYWRSQVHLAAGHTEMGSVDLEKALRLGLAPELDRQAKDALQKLKSLSAN
jgi:hypothetical protein